MQYLRDSDFAKDMRVLTYGTAVIQLELIENAEQLFKKRAKESQDVKCRNDRIHKALRAHVCANKLRELIKQMEEEEDN